jgi:hypothetical protein
MFGAQARRGLQNRWYDLAGRKDLDCKLLQLKKDVGRKPRFRGLPVCGKLLQNMAGARTNVKQLALQAGIDLDEALLRIWDVGLSYVTDINTHIRPADLNRVRRAIGIPTRRELTSPGYWQEVLHLSDGELAELLESLGIARRACASRLPKGSIAKLKGELRRRQLPATIAVKPAEPRAVVREPFEFIQIGRPADPHFLTAQNVLSIHHALARDFADADDPIEPAGVRSQALLESAVSRPQTALGDQAKYQTVEMACAALLYALVHNHAFTMGTSVRPSCRCS